MQTLQAASQALPAGSRGGQAGRETRAARICLEHDGALRPSGSHFQSNRSVYPTEQFMKAETLGVVTGPELAFPVSLPTSLPH